MGGRNPGGVSDLLRWNGFGSGSDGFAAGTGYKCGPDLGLGFVCPNPSSHI